MLAGNNGGGGFCLSLFIIGGFKYHLTLCFQKLTGGIAGVQGWNNPRKKKVERGEGKLPYK